MKHADAHYDQVARELQAKELIPGLWTRAYSEAGGQADSARALYIKLRVEQLVQEQSQREKQTKQAMKDASNIAKVKETGRRFTLGQLYFTGSFGVILIMAACANGQVVVGLVGLFLCVFVVRAHRKNKAEQKN
jgi:Flp pilus assembly protein TadB